jgi:secondary thiamine-phosphate synthase enzyme
MQHLSIKTSKKEEVVDITDILNDVLEKRAWHNGLLFVFLTHSTSALTTAELEPGTDLDMLNAFRKMIPKLKYRHPHDPKHVDDHILSSLIGTSQTIPVQNGRLMLGTWQRVVLIELNGPRERKILASFIRG